MTFLGPHEIWSNFVRGVRDREPRYQWYFFALRYPNLRGERGAGKRLVKVARNKLHELAKSKFQDPNFQPSEKDFLLLGDAFHWIAHHYEALHHFALALEAHYFAAYFYAGAKNRKSAAINFIDGLEHSFEHIARLRQVLLTQANHSEGVLSQIRSTLAPLLDARERNRQRASQVPIELLTELLGQMGIEGGFSVIDIETLRR